jgi:hypothetical protein
MRNMTVTSMIALTTAAQRRRILPIFSGVAKVDSMAALLRACWRIPRPRYKEFTLQHFAADGGLAQLCNLACLQLGALVLVRKSCVVTTSIASFT